MAINELEKAERMMYWEDLIDLPVRRFGPITCTSELLDHLLDIFGETHPVHTSDSFARSLYGRGRIVPGTFIHSLTSGWLVQHGNPTAIVGLRSVAWDYIRPIYPDTPFYFTMKTESSEPIDDKRGILVSVRKIYYEDDRLCAIGRMNTVVLRRPS